MAKPHVKHDFDYVRCFACDKRQHTTILLYRVGHHEGVLGGTACDSVTFKRTNESGIINS